MCFVEAFRGSRRDSNRARILFDKFHVGGAPAWAHCGQLVALAVVGFLAANRAGQVAASSCMSPLCGVVSPSMIFLRDTRVIPKGVGCQSRSLQRVPMISFLVDGMEEGRALAHGS